MKHDFRTMLSSPELAEDGPELLRYKQVKKITGWKSSAMIRKLVNAGILKRVRVAAHTQGLRITRASLTAYLDGLNTVEETQKFFGKTEGQWKAMREVKAAEDAAKQAETNAAENGTVVPEDKITRTDAGAFASPVSEYVDVLSGRLIPIGCYVDLDDSLICGQLDPYIAERILKIRMQRRGIRSSDSNVRYHAANISTATDAALVRSNPNDIDLAGYSLRIRKWFAERKQQ